MRNLLLATLLLLPTMVVAENHEQTQQEFDRQLVEQVLSEEEKIKPDQINDELITERLNVLNARSYILLGLNKKVRESYGQQIKQLAQIAQILMEQNNRLQNIIICLAKTEDKIETTCVPSRNDSQATLE